MDKVTELMAVVKDNLECHPGKFAEGKFIPLRQEATVD